MKNIIILLALLTNSVNATASEEKTLAIGTGALALLGGVTNLYIQSKLSNTSAIVGEYASVSGFVYSGSTITASSFAGAYKHYFKKYSSGSYFKVGAAKLSVTSSSSSSTSGGLLPIVLYGYEDKMGDNFLLGFEAGLGTTAGLGLLTVNLGYAF